MAFSYLISGASVTPWPGVALPSTCNGSSSSSKVAAAAEQDPENAKAPHAELSNPLFLELVLAVAAGGGTQEAVSGKRATLGSASELRGRECEMLRGTRICQKKGSSNVFFAWFRLLLSGAESIGL